MLSKYVSFYLLTFICGTSSRGFLLLYRPADISSQCVSSQKLRYDISFGQGLSDTTTLVLRTTSEIDYGCEIEIVTERHEMYPDIRLIIVVRFPNLIGENCISNPKAFVILKRDYCFLLCDHLRMRDRRSYFFITTSLTKFRFRFYNNSSINADMQASDYQITATSARILGNQTCLAANETICVIDKKRYCFTNGVTCDGIKNCGVTDWFDEKLSECDVNIKYITTESMIGLIALLICVFCIITHCVLRCIPPITKSFFLYNSNEDNRICIDPLFRSMKPPLKDTGKEISFERDAQVSSTSTQDAATDDGSINQSSPAFLQTLSTLSQDTQDESRRKLTMRSMSERLQNRLRSVAWRRQTFESQEEF